MSKERKTGFVYEEIFMWHNTGAAAGLIPPGLTVEPYQHGENPETKRRFRNLLDVGGLLEKLCPVKAVAVDEKYLGQYHTRDYISRIRDASAQGGGDAGELTPFGTGSFEIALLAAGGTRQAVEAVVAGKVDNAYALVRPPGHHAEKDIGRGFCLFANIALAAMHARDALGLDRVAIVDWDVHHGNGTEKAFYGDPNVLTISTHQDNFYPYDSGHMAHKGAGDGEGYNINIPLPPGSGVGAYEMAFDDVVIPALHRFKPQLIIVASGFDASGVDPFGRMMMHSAGYASLTRKLMAAADTLCGGRLVMSHEGGYSPYYTPYCGLAVMEQLSGMSTGIADPFLPIIEAWGHQDVQPHQTRVIEAAKELVGDIR